MGLPMAESLANWLSENKLPALTVWNRSEAKLPAKSDKIQHGESPEEMAKSLDIIFTSLGSDEAAIDIYGQLFEGAKTRAEKSKQEGGHIPSVILVETSTVSFDFHLLLISRRRAVL